MFPATADDASTEPAARSAPLASAPPWSLPANEVARALGSDPVAGLAREEARRRLVEIGPNEIDRDDGQSIWRTAGRQLANTMTVVLAVAALITLVIGDHADAITITVIVIINATIGFVQEHRAERAMAALSRLNAGATTVVRGGRTANVPVAELVPGDMVVLSAGDIVPADLRLADVHGLRVNEATMTGESEPSAKSDAPLAGMHLPLADRHNMAFRGTAVTYGRAAGLVVATGMSTELGRVASMLESHGTVATPLQQRLARLGRALAVAAIAACGLVFAAGVARGEPADEMLLTAVSLAVAAIPEGLPAVVTVALALGARRMAERHALIRRLPSVETLGSVTVVCTDKTGTLTQNRMAVERVWTPGGTHRVTTNGYSIEGSIDGDANDPYLARLAWAVAACNDASLQPPAEPGGEWKQTGDPTEAALLALAAKCGVDRDELVRSQPRLAELSFDASRRRMTTAHRVDGGVRVASKGALDSLAPLLHQDEAAALEAAKVAADTFAADGYRVLAIAGREVDHFSHLDDLERDLRLVGVVAMADPPRNEVAAAIATCTEAGILPVMITGDDARTALAIAHRVGLVTADFGCEGDPAEVLLTGNELDALRDDELIARVPSVRVYARTDPAQKLRIVEAWQATGAVVAMTGDGVNDAPALKRADIGVAMGMVGTDVSREAADMVLADDDFATIVAAVEEGRRIYANIRRVVRYLLTTNFGEMVLMLTAPLLGLPIPLQPIQILWVNVVTDGLPAIALGVEPASPDAMHRRPRPRDESVLAGGVWTHALWVGLLMAAVAVVMQASTRAGGWPWPTMVFMTVALLQLGHALAVRSGRHTVRRLGWRTNPTLLAAVLIGFAAQLAVVYAAPLQGIFETTSLTVGQLAVVLLASSTVFAAVELEKMWRRRSDHGA